MDSLHFISSRKDYCPRIPRVLSPFHFKWKRDSRVIESDESKKSLIDASINETSITELSPR